MTSILECDCKNDWQDNEYGQRRRLMNRTKQNDNSANTWRCTSCGKDKQGVIKDKKKK